MGRLGYQHKNPKTIKGYIAGVRSSLVDLGLDDLDAFHHPLLERAIAGIKRFNGEADKRERLPITRDILIKLINKFDQTSLVGATLHAAYCLAFAAFLRSGEFTYAKKDRSDPAFAAYNLTRQSARLETEKLYLSLPASKTDPFRKGITLIIAATHDEACPVGSLRNLFIRFPLPPTFPLFQAYNNAFTRTFLVNAVQSGIRSLGITGQFNGHSFRRGAATTARQRGLREDEIQLLGRWKSNAYKAYIQTHESHILNTSLRFQRSFPPSSSA